MWKVCLFYSQINKIFWWSNKADTFVCEIREVRKGLWALFMIVLFECRLADANSDHMLVSVAWFFLFTLVNVNILSFP